MRYGMERVAEHERELTRYTLRRLQQIPGLTLYGPSWSTMLTGQEDRLGVLSFNIEGRGYAEVTSILANEWGVGVRSGCFCAHLYVAHLLGISEEDSTEARERLLAGLPVDLPGMIRASVGIASTKGDIDRLIQGLQAIARGEIRTTYHKTEHGDVEPLHDRHTFAAHAERLLGHA
jgi:selenocysteine lyase/cysteine desulfurase